MSSSRALKAACGAPCSVSVLAGYMLSPPKAGQQHIVCSWCKAQLSSAQDTVSSAVYAGRLLLRAMAPASSHLFAK